MVLPAVQLDSVKLSRPVFGKYYEPSYGPFGSHGNIFFWGKEGSGFKA